MPAHRLVAVDAGDDDDATALAHERRRFLHGDHERLHRDCERLLHVVRLLLEDRAERGGRRVCDEDVEAPERFRHHPKGARHLPWLFEREGNGDRAASEIFDLGDHVLGGLRLVSVGDRAVGAVARQAQRDAPPDPAAAARDERGARHQYGSVSRPMSSRATMIFMISAEPSPISRPITSRRRCSKGSSSV